MNPEFSKTICKCGEHPIKTKHLTKDNPVCYRCHCKSEALRGHHVNNKARQKRVDLGLPTKTFR